MAHWCVLPTSTTGWTPIGAIPTSSSLDGLEVFFQGFAYETTGGFDRFKPTGRLDLNL